MKREPTPKWIKAIKEIYPLFSWKQCESCGLEFRREKGWRTIKEISNKRIADIYLCAKCTPTKTDATERFRQIINRILRRRQPPKISGIIPKCYRSHRSPPKYDRIP